MEAVDIIDQDLEPHDCSHKSYTLFQKLDIHLIQCMILNAKVLYNKANKTSVSLYDFLQPMTHLLKYSIG